MCSLSHGRSPPLGRGSEASERGLLPGSPPAPRRKQTPAPQVCASPGDSLAGQVESVGFGDPLAPPVAALSPAHCWGGGEAVCNLWFYGLWFPLPTVPRALGPATAPSTLNREWWRLGSPTFRRAERADGGSERCDHLDEVTQLGGSLGAQAKASPFPSLGGPFGQRKCKEQGKRISPLWNDSVEGDRLEKLFIKCRENPRWRRYLAQGAWRSFAQFCTELLKGDWE